MKRNSLEEISKPEEPVIGNNCCGRLESDNLPKMMIRGLCYLVFAVPLVVEGAIYTGLDIGKFFKSWNDSAEVRDTRRELFKEYFRVPGAGVL